ncbi:MAG: transcription termination/antitermination protein NusG [Chitinophagales bacterium]|jgi:transcriptional antiterminator NusG
MQDTKWYVLRVISGQERKIQQYVTREIERIGYQDEVRQILVPLEKVYKIKAGKKVIKERNMFPGYIYVEMTDKAVNNGDVLMMIAGTTNVINFIGGRRPEPIREAEVRRLLGKVDEFEQRDEEMVEPFMINETVKIIDGPFNDFTGSVEEIMDEKKKLKVVVKIFGRRTPVEVNYMQVEKIA